MITIATITITNAIITTIHLIVIIISIIIVVIIIVAIIIIIRRTLFVRGKGHQGHGGLAAVTLVGARGSTVISYQYACQYHINCVLCMCVYLWIAVVYCVLCAYVFFVCLCFHQNLYSARTWIPMSGTGRDIDTDTKFNTTFYVYCNIKKWCYSALRIEHVLYLSLWNGTCITMYAWT